MEVAVRFRLWEETMLLMLLMLLLLCKLSSPEQGKSKI